MTKQYYTRYDETTGIIRGHCFGRREDAGYDWGIIEGNYSAEEYIIVDGQPQRKTDADIEQQQIDKAWLEVRNTRTLFLKDSDWTQVPDAPVDAAAWAVYRQQLRDLPANTTDPRNVVWPEPPS